jgi:hypothetical protein
MLNFLLARLLRSHLQARSEKKKVLYGLSLFVLRSTSNLAVCGGETGSGTHSRSHSRSPDTAQTRRTWTRTSAFRLVVRLWCLSGRCRGSNMRAQQAAGNAHTQHAHAHAGARTTRGAMRKPRDCPRHRSRMWSDHARHWLWARGRGEGAKRQQTAQHVHEHTHRCSRA